MTGQAVENIHATAVVIGDRGVLIRGPSGSGKSTLALALLARCAGPAQFARLVADDRVEVCERGGRVIARVPATIAGLCEIPGLGPHPVRHEAGAVVDLVVRLVGATVAPRFSDDPAEVVAGLRLPSLALAARNAAATVPAVLARLDLLDRPAGCRPARGNLPSGADDLGLSTENASTR